jgi:2-polyprenyl-3-methyl-5-hydroxy-6-metoxy-1,4-benzoquinol methylase
MEPIPQAEHGTAKPADYYEVVNSGILGLIPPDARRLLDVGCASGGLGEAFKQSRAGAIAHGIERNPHARERAAKRLDRVFDLDLNQPLPELDGPYDCITCCDVLEHVIDPWTLLRSLTEELAPGGSVVASIPNLRFYPVVRDLVLRGRFTYRESGVLDSTHLRFFTYPEMVELFRSAGLEVVQSRPVIERRVLKKVPKLIRKRLDAFRAIQYQLAGRRRVE